MDDERRPTKKKGRRQ